jgi:hypothetical protein
VNPKAGTTIGTVPLETPSPRRQVELHEEPDVEAVVREASPAAGAIDPVSGIPGADAILDPVGGGERSVDGDFVDEGSAGTAGELLEPVAPIQELLSTDPLPLPIELGL